ARERRRKQEVCRLRGGAGTRAEKRAQLAEAAGQLRGLLLLGERVGSGRELLEDRLERGRGSELRPIVVGMGDGRRGRRGLGSRRGRDRHAQQRGRGRGDEERENRSALATGTEDAAHAAWAGGG